MEIRGKTSATAMTKAGNPNEWYTATLGEIIEESPAVKSFVFDTPSSVTNLAGQHFELRLTAPNGYQAARLYSASEPGNGQNTLKLTVMEVINGEVSPYLHDALEIGDQVELRGPFGRFFVWTPENTQPTLLIGGGSGVVPMHAIFTAHTQSHSESEMKLLYSSHTYEDILYKNDFVDNPNVTITLSRNQPANWKGRSGRITSELVTEMVESFQELPVCYVCGMSAFVDAITEALQQAGVPATSIKTERFG